MSTIMSISNTPTQRPSDTVLTLTDHYLSFQSPVGKSIPHIILFQVDALRCATTAKIITHMVMVLEVQTPYAPMLVARFSETTTSLGGGGNGNVTYIGNIDHKVEFNKWNGVVCTRAYWNRLVKVGYHKLTDEEAEAVDQTKKHRRAIERIENNIRNTTIGPLKP
jgi:hypothetical protein